MNFPKTIPVRFTDTVEIDVDEDGDVRLRINREHVYLDPKQARQVVKALKKAAKTAEEV